MRKIFYFLLLFILPFVILPKAYAQTIPFCPPGGSDAYTGKVQTTTDVLDRGRALPPDSTINDRTLLSDDKKARFTIDVNRDTNTAGLGVEKWSMQWQCGVSLPGQQGFINTNPVEAQSSLGTRNIFVDLDQSGFINTLNNRCEFDPKNNPLTVRVKAKIRGGNEVDFCQASYSVFDADRLCTLDIADSSGNSATKITPNSDLQVTGKGLTDKNTFVLLFDNDPIWSAVQTEGLIIKQDRFISVNSPKTPDFSSGYSIDKKYLTLGEHRVSLHRYINNPVVNTFMPGNPSVDRTQLCSCTLLVGDASNPGKVTCQGGTLTTTSVSTPCVSSSCAISGGSGCDNNTGFTTAIGCIHTKPDVLVKDFITFIIGISGGLAFLMMLLGAFQMLTSAGNPETLQAGRDRLTSAIIGLLFVIFAVLLMQIIGVDILKLPDFNR